jgi:hypothetical protein
VDQGDEKNTYKVPRRVNIENVKRGAREESSEDEGKKMVECRKGEKTKRLPQR